MNIEPSWLLLLPVMMAALYGLTEHKAMATLGLPRRKGVKTGLTVFFLTALLNAAWSAVYFPLPVFYLLLYVAFMVRFLPGARSSTKNLFLLNLCYVNTLAVQLVFICVIALVEGTAMRDVLTDPVLRTASATVTIGVNVLEDMLFLCNERLPNMLKEITESEEGRLFMAFLWFCTGYLLVDSFLCISGAETLFTPLFLIGSSSILMVFQVLFLWHINSILQANHLADEHNALERELEARDKSARVFQHLAERDGLTGAYSRRYIMEELGHLLEADICFSIVYLDLDHLKRVNDREGHGAGDRYLIQFTEDLRSKLRDGDMLARVGGDEFLVLMPGCEGDTATERIAKIRSDMETASKRGQFSFSIGVAVHQSGDSSDIEALIREADRAMYQDKRCRR